MRRITFVCAVVFLCATATVALGSTIVRSASLQIESAGHLSRTPAYQQRRSHPQRLTVSLKTTADTAVATSASSADDPVLFGDQQVEPTLDYNTPGMAEAFPFVAQLTGEAQTITFYLDSRNKATTLIAGLYSDSGEHPGSRLASGTLTSPRAGAWNSVSVPNTVVKADQIYWIALLGRGGSEYFRDRKAGPCDSENSHQSTLTALPSSWTIGKRWDTCPVSAYVGGTVASTLSPPPPSSGTASPPSSSGSGLPVPPLDTAPPQISGTPTEGQTLSAGTGSWSGSPTSYAYQWQDCDSLGLVCTNVSGATSSVYTLTANDVGSSMRVLVTAFNGTDSLPAASALTSSVAAEPVPSNAGLPQVSGTTTQGQVLTTTNGTWASSPTSYGYQWQDCNSSGNSCSTISGATSTSYTLTSSDVGHTIRAVVSAANAAGTTAATSAATAQVASNVPAAPTNTAPPQVSGTTTQGDALTTTNGSWTGNPTGYTYTWEDCNGTGGSCTTISGATSHSYTLTSNDVGDTIRSVVTAGNGGGSAAATSAATSVVAAPSGGGTTPPSNTAAPQVSGTPTQGNTLTATNGSWTGSPTGYGYQWQDCDTGGNNCATIGGATSSSYTLTSGDVGDTIRAIVTATNAGGSGSGTSAATATVSASPSGSAGCSSTLTPSTFTANAVSAAAGGSVLCLTSGTYNALSINKANPSSYVTIQPAPGAGVTVDGTFTINNSSFLRFQGLTITGGGAGGSTGFNVTGNPSHDFQFVDDNIGNGTFGVVLDGSSGTSNVLIQGDQIHDLDFTGSSAGYAGGQGVTCYYCLSNITVSYSTFWSNSWHYIQCGGCSNMTVDHNLFRCPCNQHSGAHLNVFQIWQGGSNDSFTNNIVVGNPNQVGGSGEICAGCILFENGAGGGTASDTFSNYDVSNNLFVNSGASLPIQVQTTSGGTVSNNTVADGFQYGVAMGFNAALNNASTNLTAQYNVVAGQTDNGQAFEYGCDSGCVSTYNIADSHGGTAGTGSMNGWKESWQTTTWDPTSGNPPPAGYYQPNGLSSSYGYQGTIGPWTSGS